MQQKLMELEDKFEEEKKKAKEEAEQRLAEQMKMAEERKAQMEKEFEEKMHQIQAQGGSEEDVKKLKEEHAKQTVEAESVIKTTEEIIKKQADENCSPGGDSIHSLGVERRSRQKGQQKQKTWGANLFSQLSWRTLKNRLILAISTDGR